MIKNKNIGIVIQARTSSTRLPQKVIMPFFDKKGILEIVINRLNEAELNVPIVLASTINPSDNIIETIGNNLKINVFRGSENNVLDRFVKAAEAQGIEKIIRICADNPFLDLGALKFQIGAFLKTDTDYWCYCKSDKTPTIKTHYGFWTEGVSLDALKKVVARANKKIFQEHVTNYIYINSDDFIIHYEKINESIEAEKNIRLTIDTEKDFELAKEIYYELINKHIQFTSNEITQFIRLRPEWLAIMQNEIKINSK